MRGKSLEKVSESLFTLRYVDDFFFWLKKINSFVYKDVGFFGVLHVIYGPWF